MFLSDDIVHDAPVVFKFETEAVEYLNKKGVPCRKFIEFTDGCASQYRSKTPFRYICTRHDTEVQRCFFGADMAKGHVTRLLQ